MEKVRKWEVWEVEGGWAVEGEGWMRRVGWLAEVGVEEKVEGGMGEED